MNYPCFNGGMFATAAALSVDDAAKKQLESLVRSGTTPQRVAQKCRVILLAQEGISNHSIAKQLGLSRPTVIAARATFDAGGVPALTAKPTRKPAAPDSDSGVGEKDFGYNSENQAAGRNPVDRANARQTPARVAHDGASGLAAFRHSAPPGREIQIVQRSAV
jgi:hypothetical protein